MLYHTTHSLLGRARAQGNFYQWISGEATATQPQKELQREEQCSHMQTLKGFLPWDAADQDGKAEMIYVHFS